MSLELTTVSAPPSGPTTGDILPLVRGTTLYKLDWSAVTGYVGTAISAALSGYATTSSVTSSISAAVAGLATASSVTAEAAARAAADALLLSLTGGTMTGPITLSGAPTANLHPATKAYVDAAALAGGGAQPSTSTPLIDSGTGVIGTGTTYARADHQHPVDTSRYAASNPSGYQTTSQVNSAIQAVVGAAPTALDTLVEIAAQLQSDETAAGALTTLVGTKAPIDSPTFTTKLTLPSVSAGVSTAGTVVFNTSTGRYEFGIGGSTVNHVRLGGDTMTGVLTLNATPSANDNSLKAATTAYSDRAFTSTAPGAVPASGGGTVNFLRADGTFAAPPGGTSSVPVTTVATSGASQALAFPASGSAAYDITLSANCTLTLTGGTAGQRQSVLVQLRGGSTGYTTTWPAGIVWAGGVTPPSLPSGSIIEVTLATYDGGTTILGKFE